MKILKIPEPAFDTFKIETPTGSKILPRLGIGNSIGDVIANLTQTDLCEVRDEIKKVEVNLGKYYNNLQKKPDLGNYEDVDWNSLSDNIKQKSLIHGVYGYFIWGDDDHDITCHSFKDITVVWNLRTDKYDFYSTPEVLQVIDQWIEYLDKFYAENKSSNQKN